MKLPYDVYSDQKCNSKDNTGHSDDDASSRTAWCVLQEEEPVAKDRRPKPKTRETREHLNSAGSLSPPDSQRSVAVDNPPSNPVPIIATSSAGSVHPSLSSFTTLTNSESSTVATKAMPAPKYNAALYPST